jgi:hypothetical protein
MKYLIILAFTFCIVIPDGQGKIAEKFYESAHSELIPIAGYKTIITVPEYVPEKWYVTIVFKGKARKHEVSRLEYSECAKGDRFYREYPRCRREEKK